MARTRARQRSPRSTPSGSLPQVNANAAGIDMGAASHVVAVPADRDAEPVREFAAFTGDPYRPADRPRACGVETVVRPPPRSPDHRITTRPDLVIETWEGSRSAVLVSMRSLASGC